MDFTFLRLLLALSVVFAHYHEITGATLWWAHGISALVAVQAFFVISGWIVTGSYVSSTSLSAFFVRRLARLYPLYAVVVIAQAITVIALPTTRDGSWSELVRYLAANLSFANFLQPSLFGFLDGTRLPAINPSLWTLKIEVLFYLSVPLWVMFNRRFGAWALLGLYVASTLYFYLVHPVSAELAKQLPGQMRFFVAGMVCRALFEHRLKVENLSTALVASIGIAGLALAHYADSSYALAAVQPLFVAAVVVAAGRLLPRMKAAPDLSFGVYLIHAPVIQFTHQTSLVSAGSHGLTVALVLTVLFSVLAWFVIERPAIRAGQRLSQRVSAARGRPVKPPMRQIHEAS